MENNNKELWKSFIEFQKDFKGMKPDATNPFFKSTYITLDGILETVRPILSKHGLAVLQEAKGINGSVTIKTRLVHETGQYYETDVLEMKPQKANDPQQMGSCITYAKRYQLAALLGICESVDDDANVATYGNKTNNSTKYDSAKTYKCASCGKETPENVAKFSYSKYRKILCMDCQKN